MIKKILPMGCFLIFTFWPKFTTYNKFVGIVFHILGRMWLIQNRATKNRWNAKKIAKHALKVPTGGNGKRNLADF